jgi:hypothetical protein
MRLLTNIKEAITSFIYGLSSYVGYGATIYLKYDLNPILKTIL